MFLNDPKPSKTGLSGKAIWPCLAGGLVRHPRQSQPFDDYLNLPLIAHHLMPATDIRERGLG